MSLACQNQNRFQCHQLLIALMVSCFVNAPALGQKNTTSIDLNNKSPSVRVENVDRDTTATATPTFEQVEAEAIEFVKEHHPELVSLLQLLKAMRQKEYEAAIRDIVKARKRLESIVKREPETHAIELAGWKLQSKIDLLLARGFARDKAFDTKILRGLLQDQVENQKRRLKNEQVNIIKRQEQVADALGRLEGHEDEKIEQQLAALMKRVDAKTDKVIKPKSGAKPTKEAKDKP